MAVPQYDDLMNPTLKALHNLGGKADIHAIEDKVAKILNLSEEDIFDIHRDSTTKLSYRLAWARNYLKRFGLLENVSRGVWALTSAGYQTNDVDKEKVKVIVKANDIENDIKNEEYDAIVNPDVEHEEVSNKGEIIKPFDPKKIDIKSKSMILDSIFKRIKRNEINLFTEFQRQGNLWDKTKQSRLIESVLIRFPLPAFYFDGTDDNSWAVVDGLQRISSLKNFVVDKTLRLENLEFLELNGFSFDDLPSHLQRRIEESEINVYIINPGTPDEVKYNIFKRINTGGLILEPQEIRHAINQGEPAKLIKELADREEFKRATCYSIKTSRMLDRDFVTRFVSFYLNNYKEYEPDLDTFMNKSMANINKLNETQKLKLKEDFIKAMIVSYEIFRDDAFRKRYSKNDNRKPINKALFEVWSVSISRLSTSELQNLINKKEIIQEQFIKLMITDPGFSQALSSGTGDKTRVIKRFSEVENLINKVVKQ